jgi:ribonuclease HII
MAKHKTVAFTDAVGTGSLFGPITACAVTMPFKCSLPEGVDDSKKLSHESINRLAPILKGKMTWAIGTVSAEELLGIKNNLKGEHLAMTRAVWALKKLMKIDAVFVDGKFPLPKTDLPSYAVIKGDQKVLGIAAASIIAKDHRDHIMMDEFDKIYPEYDLKNCKGYKSPVHNLAIKKYGLTKFHRSYLPYVRKLVYGY